MATLKDSEKTGRGLFWTGRGIEECGGGFLGLFLFKLLERNQKRKQESSIKSRTDGFFDSILKRLEE